MFSNSNILYKFSSMFDGFENPSYKDMFEDNKRGIRNRKSKDKQYNDQRKEQKDKKEQFVDGKRSNQKL